ncbi:MAG: DUF4397 domain-containing protein [Planctomycetes bacterium]|nr:DUF4397 domain-containing protein [Planctomycetota bacterium]
MRSSTLRSTALLLGLLTSGISAQNAELTVLHGVPGLSGPVEVFANGGSLFTFDYGDQLGPLSLPAAGYAIDVRLNGVTILTANVNLAADTSYSAIAHLDAAGTPTISLFDNDDSALALPKSRLAIRHTAQAPAVDVVLQQNGATVATFGNLSNPNEVAADVAPGNYSASLFVANTTTRAFGPVDLALEDGYRYIVYAVGDVSGPSFRLLVQRTALTARVTVIHGIPGLPAPVDVFAGNTRLFSFDFGDSQGPLVLNPAQYALSVRLQGQTVLSANPTLAAGDDVTIVAHLDAAGTGNVLSIFANDVSSLTSGARLTVRHTAAAPAVDVALDALGNRVATIRNLSNGNEATAPVPSGLYAASLFAAGTTTRAFGPVALKPATGVHYLVHAIGDLNVGSFTLVVQTIDLAGAVPGSLTASVAGVSCGPTIAPSSAAIQFGEPFSLLIRGGDANAMGVINVGDSNTASGALSLPFSLAGAGAPGCFIATNFLASHPIMLDSNGAASASFVVPRLAFGLPAVYFQAASRTTGNALGLESTDVVELRQN